MNTYDFSALNAREFEALVADLLSEEHGVHVELFKPGKDAGVDGRWFAPDGREVILQCKHWQRSGYTALLASLRKDERPKLDRLKPGRYILATSVPLSRKNKDEIARILAPYLSASDVLGPEDLNYLLARHKKVEERNYKLWLSSISTLGSLLNNAIIGRSRSELALFREGATLYVETEDYQRAWRHLNDRRVLILTGEPGIGKTTLARQLILDYVRLGFGFAAIEENVSEAEAVYDEDAKQIFYFDDFLGRTFLGALNAKQDSHIANFAQRVEKAPNKRFILTSRTNILNQGAVLSDLFGSAQLMKSAYELRIGSLTKIDRAKILYNHIWHSDLDSDYIDQLYSEKRYHKIIDHRNFNPRLIAFILDSNKLMGVAPAGYWDYIERTLDNPEDVWTHFFSAQLDQDCRDLVFITVLNGGSIGENNLRTAFSSLPRREKDHMGAIHHAFDKAIRQASGSVLNREIESSSQEVSYSIFNPSIEDYALRYLAHAQLWSWYYPHIRTDDALLQLRHLRGASFMGVDKYNEILHLLAEADAQHIGAPDNYSLALAALIVSNKRLRVTHSEQLRLWITEPDLHAVAAQPWNYIQVLLGWREFATRDELIEHAPNILSALSAMYILVDEHRAIKALLSDLRALGLDDVHEFLRAKILKEWECEVARIVWESSLLSQYRDYEDIWSAEDALKVFLRGKLSETGIEPTASELSKLCSEVPLKGLIKSKIEIALREDWQADSTRNRRITEQENTAAVDDIFERDGR